MENKIDYEKLDSSNFDRNSLDHFKRHQIVCECWRKQEGTWRLVPNCFEENWSLSQCQEIAEDIIKHMNRDQTGFGAFNQEKEVVGFLTVSHHIFGKTARYAELVCFQVSEDYRNLGIGRKLFSYACEEAVRLGAEKLYISAHSSKESQAAYQALGCTLAAEINQALALEEPFDVQLEYKLAK